MKEPTEPMKLWAMEFVRQMRAYETRKDLMPESRITMAACEASEIFPLSVEEWEEVQDLCARGKIFELVKDIPKRG